MPVSQSKQGWGGRIASAPLYPFLIGLFPILWLTAANLGQIDLASAYRPFLVSLLLAVILFILFRLSLHNATRAGLPVTALLILFYSYGHVYNLLLSAGLVTPGWQGAIRLLGLWLILAVLAVWGATRTRMNAIGWSPALNLLSAVLLIYPCFQIARFELNHRPSPAAPAAASVSGPDIYYIILDAYNRADTLQQVYDYDNSAFLTGLTQRGFYVASCSQSNYAYTQPSLASSLNMDYLQNLGVASHAQADPLLQANAARRFLESRGYTTVAFESGFAWSQWEDADVYYRYQPQAASLTPFEALFLRTTVVRAALELSRTSQAPYGKIPHDRVLYILDTLGKVPQAVPGPKFVFVHLSIPHPPFLFGPNGEFVTAGAENATNRQGYRNSVTFLNKRILQVVEAIQAESVSPPVIILQGDHGAPLYHNPFQRMAILNAYALPAHAAGLYPSISPVNTFRLVFNDYFGQQVPLLDDVSYYSAPSSEYEFGAIPNQCK